MASEDREMLRRYYERVRQDEKGREIPDPTPVAIPAGFKKPETMAELVRSLTRSTALELLAAEQDIDTFEEAEDFDIDDDSFDPNSPFEEIFDPVLNRGITAEEWERNREVYEKRYQAAFSSAYNELDRSDALRGRRRQSPPAEQSGPKAAKEVPAKE